MESAKVGRNRQSLQKHSERPVPCEQGAADLEASPYAADPMKEQNCNGANEHARMLERKRAWTLAALQFPSFMGSTADGEA